MFFATTNYKILDTTEKLQYLSARQSFDLICLKQQKARFVGKMFKRKSVCHSEDSWQDSVDNWHPLQILFDNGINTVKIVGPWITCPDLCLFFLNK